MAETKNLGWVQAIISSTIAPTNKKMIWYDENTDLHKYWNIGLNSWVSFLGSSVSFVEVISDTTGAKTLKLTLGDGTEVYTDSICCNEKNVTVTADYNTCPDSLISVLGSTVSELEINGYIKDESENVSGDVVVQKTLSLLF